MKISIKKLSIFPLICLSLLLFSCSDTGFEGTLKDESRAAALLTECEDLGQEHIDSFIFFW